MYGAVGDNRYDKNHVPYSGADNKGSFSPIWEAFDWAVKSRTPVAKGAFRATVKKLYLSVVECPGGNSDVHFINFLFIECIEIA